MKAKLFFLLITGFALSMLSCNSDSVGTPNDDNTAGTYGTGTSSEVPGDSVRVEPPNIPDPEEPDMSNESRFTQSDLDMIAALKNQIPVNIIVDFEEKYIIWEKTWSRPEIAIHSNSRKYAESDEYESLLTYSLKYGNAFLPLIFEKLNQGEILVVNLLQDLTFPENKQLYDDIMSYLSSKVEVGKPLPSDLSIWIDYSKKLLTILFG